MGRVEEAFTARLGELLRSEPWDVELLSGPQRRAYFGGDRLREWIQPDVWATLDGLPGRPTFLAEIDTAPADLEHNVAKYLWWVSGREPFWNLPALLLNAFTMRKEKDYLLHENVATFLGELLCARISGQRHVVVDLRAEPLTEEVGARLAELAFERVKDWVKEVE